MKENEENVNLVEANFLINTRIIYGCSQLKQRPRRGHIDNRHLYPSSVSRVVVVESSSSEQ